MSDDEFVPKDFVYCGLRMSTKGTLIAQIRVIEENNELGIGQCYESKLFKTRIVGGVYTGAVFGREQVKVGNITYQKKWDDWMQVEGWRVEEDLAKAEDKCMKLEARERNKREIDDALRPWRKMYSIYVRQHDMMSAEALVHYVTRSLRKPFKD